MMQPLALFDLDNTLVDLDEAFLAWSSEFVTEHGLDRSEGLVWLMKQNRTGIPHRNVFFGMVRERFGLKDDVAVLWARYRERMPDLVHCRTEVLEGLGALRDEGWRVGIVANGMADNQRGKIERTGLAAVVDGWAIAGTEGVSKPDVRLFAIAAARCGVKLSGGGWMIGNDPITDIAGGRGAGLRTIWVTSDPKALDCDADHAVRDVVQAIELLLMCGPDSSASYA